MKATIIDNRTVSKVFDRDNIDCGHMYLCHKHRQVCICCDDDGITYLDDGTHIKYDNLEDYSFTPINCKIEILEDA